MIAAAVFSCDALDGGRQIAIALGDKARQVIDLLGGFRRSLELDPAADAGKDPLCIEGCVSGHGVVLPKGNVWSVATDIAHFNACAAGASRRSIEGIVARRRSRFQGLAGCSWS